MLPSSPTASIRLLCVVLTAAIITILAVASHKESCGWNDHSAPNYECGIITAMEKTK